jgi:uncharacterized membrane protein
MKGIPQLIRTTLVGGLLFLVPITVLGIVLGKALALGHKLVGPLAARIPVQSVIGLRTPALLAISLIVLLCFLARIEDAWQMAFLVERIEGGHVAVFVPGAPNPLSGSLFFLPEDRIKPAHIPPAAALKCLKRLGAGSNVLLRGLSLTNP